MLLMARVGLIGDGIARGGVGLLVLGKRAGVARSLLRLRCALAILLVVAAIVARGRGGALLVVLLAIDLRSAGT